MARPVRIAIICLSVLLALSLGGNLWLWLAEGATIKRWERIAAKLEKDNERLEAERFRMEQRVDGLKDVAATLAARIPEQDAQIAELEKAVEEAGEPPPEAQKYTKPRDAARRALVVKIDLLEEGLSACKETVEEQDKIILKGKEIEENQDKQVSGWKKNSRKAQKRYRAKLAVSAILISGVSFGLGRASSR